MIEKNVIVLCLIESNQINCLIQVFLTKNKEKDKKDCLIEVATDRIYKYQYHLMLRVQAQHGVFAPFPPPWEKNKFSESELFFPHPNSNILVQFPFSFPFLLFKRTGPKVDLK
jgi:hypothetical protein